LPMLLILVRVILCILGLHRLKRIPAGRIGFDIVATEVSQSRTLFRDRGTHFGAKHGIGSLFLSGRHAVV